MATDVFEVEADEVLVVAVFAAGLHVLGGHFFTFGVACGRELRVGNGSCDQYRPDWRGEVEHRRVRTSGGRSRCSPRQLGGCASRLRDDWAGIGLPGESRSSIVPDPGRDLKLEYRRLTRANAGSSRVTVLFYPVARLNPLGDRFAGRFEPGRARRASPRTPATAATPRRARPGRRPSTRRSAEVGRGERVALAARPHRDVLRGPRPNPGSAQQRRRRSRRGRGRGRSVELAVARRPAAKPADRPGPGAR